MGDELDEDVELRVVESDTMTLRGKGRRPGADADPRSGGGGHPTPRPPLRGALFALALPAGCSSDGLPGLPDAATPQEPDGVAQAQALVDGAPLPPRLETVAL